MQNDRHKYCHISSTDNRCQFITLSIHLCVQHDGCEAARRAGLSVAAETCRVYLCWLVGSPAAISDDTVADLLPPALQRHST